MENIYIAIANKGKEYLYRRSTVIKCNSEKQALALRNHLNKYNEKSFNGFKCSENETWHIFSDLEALYKVKETKGKISLTILS